MKHKLPPVKKLTWNLSDSCIDQYSYCWTTGRSGFTFRYHNVLGTIELKLWIKGQEKSPLDFWSCNWRFSTEEEVRTFVDKLDKHLCKI